MVYTLFVMATQTKRPEQQHGNGKPFRLVALIPEDLLEKLDAEVMRGGFGVSRADIVRKILRRALDASEPTGIRAAS